MCFICSYYTAPPPRAISLNYRPKLNQNLTASCFQESKRHIHIHTQRPASPVRRCKAQVCKNCKLFKMTPFPQIPVTPEAASFPRSQREPHVQTRKLASSGPRSNSLAYKGGGGGRGSARRLGGGSPGSASTPRSWQRAQGPPGAG